METECSERERMKKKCVYAEKHKMNHNLQKLEAKNKSI